jgi:hypothetical protein
MSVFEGLALAIFAFVILCCLRMIDLNFVISESDISGDE